jgi:hypothetical protein
MTKEYIICAAIWYKELPTQTFLPKNLDKGVVVCGHRHGHCIDIMKTLGQLRSVVSGPDSVGENEEGFLYLSTIENNSVDLILTDPPYIISKDSGMNEHYKNVKSNEENNVAFVKTESNWNEYKKTHNIVQGVYELKNIVLFTKCSNLCNDISIYMKNDFALTSIYTIATLGNITIALSPVKEENIRNITYNYSDDEGDEVDEVSKNNIELV